RPPNSFMCFRSDRFRHYQRSAKDAAPLLQTELSKRVAKEWNDLDSERRAHYEGVAAEKKAEHMRMYPGYKYQPRR
ncbi:high mobility group box domain-containing protein, partial [Fomitopsis serialis]|uniref:high mobility group box domain-containing protein n=1 Tax=Fomitopsis serialis TaxID=139415 RepID=UPI0020074CDA